MKKKKRKHLKPVPPGIYHVQFGKVKVTKKGLVLVVDVVHPVAHGGTLH